MIWRSYVKPCALKLILRRQFLYWGENWNASLSVFGLWTSRFGKSPWNFLAHLCRSNCNSRDRHQRQIIPISGGRENLEGVCLGEIDSALDWALISSGPEMLQLSTYLIQWILNTRYSSSTSREFWKMQLCWKVTEVQVQTSSGWERPRTWISCFLSYLG